MEGSDFWSIRTRRLPLGEPLVVGVLNVTPDSFSDGGRHTGVEVALRRALEMAGEGAGMIDLGGESTRPGAAPVPEGEELARVVPVLRRLSREVPLPVSIDTRRAAVARAALDEGAEVVNDVTALSDPDMPEVVAASGAGVVLMHMRGTPRTMQDHPHYADVAEEVVSELAAACARADGAGIRREQVVVDPGIGFAKTREHNLELLARLRELDVLGRPVMLGVSRKAFLGQLLGGAPPEARAVATAAACVAGYERGARIFRVHDVRVVREALTVAASIRAAGP